ncbi:MAG: PAS domain S-box protein [Deltaproteobacteria bacterium]|nr:PAS domain S-box protein [Deltaproteobacteria bacterium]
MNTYNKETGSAPAAVQKRIGEDAERAYQDSFRANRLGGLAVSAVILFGLYLSTLHDYLLFHTLVELFSIVVGCGIFIIAWNSRRLLDNNYLLFLGIAYLFVAFLDLIHTLAYKGMPIFQGNGADLPTQLWITARYMQSLSLLIAPFFLRRRLRSGMALGAYSLLTLLVLASLFLWPIFPSCFIEGRGLTPFKKISEYIISAILLAALAVLFRNRHEFDRDVFQWLSASISITIVAELAFTFYVSVHGLSNMVGHFCKLISFYLIYKAIIQTGLKKPYDLLFRNLRQSEQRLSQIIDFLPDATFVIDRQGKVVAWNRALEKMTGIRSEEMVGKGDYEYAIPFYGKKRPVLIDLVHAWDEETQKTYHYVKKQGDALVSETVNSLVAPGGTLWNKASVFRDENGAVIGAIETIRDISDRKQQEEEREKLIQELQTALSQIRKLSGMLPICASCKKIRDDKGYWQQVEAYITTHSEVRFSHSVCPECARELYPECYEEMFPEGQGEKG